MALECEVRTFKQSEWRIYKDLRLRALSESPDAYGRTLDEELQRSDDEWETRLERAQDRQTSLPIFAMCNKTPVGLAWGRIDMSEPQVAHVFQVWVDPHYRNRGVGQQLLGELVGWAREIRVRWVELNVTQGNGPAMSLYGRLGFRPYGDLTPLREGSPLMMQSMRLAMNAEE